MTNTTLNRQTDVLKKDLIEAGFNCTIRSNRNITNEVYTKRGCAYVCVFISNSVAQDRGIRCYPLLLDADFYKSIADASLITIKERKTGLVPALRTPETLIPLHRLVMQAKRGQDVDHISHNPMVCIKEMLRLCNNTYNNANKPCRSKITGNTFTLTTELVNEHKEILTFMGYTVSKNKIQSISYKTKAAMLHDIAIVENLLFKQFRYNPLVDFSGESWVIPFYQKLLGLDDATANSLQRDLIKKFRPDICMYYSVA